MYYNLEGFGKKVTSIRKIHNLTREQLSKLSFVSIETIRKIETGKYIPSHKILDDLSAVLKIDLNEILLKYRLEDFQTFDDLKNRMEVKFDRNEYDTLEKEYEDFDDLLSYTKNQYFQKIIRQLMLLTKAVIINHKENNPTKSLETLIEAICITTPNFSLSNYQSYVYNSTEIRILMNIALLLRKLKSKEEAIEILEFCINMIDSDDEIYPKLCHNLSGIYVLIKQYSKALKYSNLGIDCCLYKRKYPGLNILYYGKGIAEYNLGYDKYMESLNKAISFCDVLGQEKLKKVIIYKCKKFYDIKLELK
ncbi:MAG: helix-turn-helix transcriptional regulator [Tissierellia bacterium]|nr:helix-turn-helix transcriptional regulator [Tissierellia bacterium]